MLEDLKNELQQLNSRGQLRTLRPRGTRHNGIIESGERAFIDFLSWDIFGLRENPRVRRAAQQQIELDGVAESSARLAYGNTRVHLALERRIAGFLGAEDSLLFSSRNQAVFSLFTALSSERDAIFVEESQHGPVSDACYLVNAPVYSFTFSDLDALADELDRARSARRRIISFDVVSSWNGERADLASLAGIAERFDAHLILDESCSLGTVGTRGAGAIETAAISSRVLARYGSLAHTLGGYGGFVCAGKVLIQYLLNRSRTFTNENPLPASIAAAIDVSVDVVERSPSVRERVLGHAARIKRTLSGFGFSNVGQSETPIVGVPAKSFRAALATVSALERKGFLVEAIPGTAALSEECMVRLIVSCHHTEKHIDDLLQAFAEIAPKVLEE